jgi:hypothetical protein
MHEGTQFSQAFCIDLDSKREDAGGVPVLEEFVEVIEGSFPQQHVPLLRMVAVLLSQGKSASEIALLLKLSEGQVRALLQVKELTSILNELPDQQVIIERVLQGTVLDTVNFLRQIRDNQQAPYPSRVQAAKLLLDHALGTAEPKSKKNLLNQLDSDGIVDPVEKARYIDEQIKKLNLVS